MADNAPLPLATGSIRAAATDQVTYSGDVADVQLVRLVDVTGAEGSKTVVSPYSLVSTANSSAVNIAGAGTFIGPAEDVSSYSHVSVVIFSSHASATDGLQIQQSTNGTDWDFSDVFTIPAAAGKAFSVPVQAQFFRINYANGATLTTAFRLQVIYSKQTKKGSSNRPQDGRANENDFEEVNSYLSAFNGTTWDRLRSTTANGLAVDVTRSAPDVTASGSLAGAAQVVTLALAGQSAAAAQITGTWVGTITFEASLDGTTWTAINAVSASTSTPQTTTTVNGLYRVTPGGLQQIRANMSAFTSGSASVLMRAGAGAGGTFANQILPTKNTDGVSSQAIKAASTAAVAADQAAVVSLSPNSPVALATITKGTQGATGVTTQDLKDAGRVMWSAASAIAGVTAVTAEALVTMIVQRDGTAIATATSHTVTAGKRLRITSMNAGIISTGASVLSGRVSLRIGAAGAATATSPIVVTLAIPSGAALAQAGGAASMSFPDGIELSGAMQIGISQVCSAATGTIWVNFAGFEY